MFPPDDYSKTAKKKKTNDTVNSQQSVEEIVQQYREQEKQKENEQNAANKKPTAQVVLEAELESKTRELEKYQQTESYQRSHYSASTVNEEVLRMETGLPTREVFNIVVLYTLRFKDSIRYFYGWVVNSITFEDQIFITLMKVSLLLVG